MSENKNNQDEISRIINSALNAEDEGDLSILRTKFEQRLSELNITPNQAVENLQIEYRTLYGILDGTIKRLDILSLLMIAQFLEISYNEIVELYVKATTNKHKDELVQSKKRNFI